MRGASGRRLFRDNVEIRRVRRQHAADVDLPARNAERAPGRAGSGVLLRPRPDARDDSPASATPLNTGGGSRSILGAMSDVRNVIMMTPLPDRQMTPEAMNQARLKYRSDHWRR